MLKKSYEIVGIFQNKEDLDYSVNELFAHGFDQSKLSVPSDEITIQQKLKYKSSSSGFSFMIIPL